MTAFSASGSSVCDTTVQFGNFLLRPQRALYRDGKSVALGGRALDLLTAIVMARGEVVSRDTLMEAAWPGRVVVENALHQHIRALRTALGDNASLIQTVSGRGYRLTLNVESQIDKPSVGGRPSRPPSPTTPILGRGRELHVLSGKLAEQRCVTVVGAAGVGKTRLIAELAVRRSASGGEVAWCDLSSVQEGERLPAAVARGLGLPESVVGRAGGALDLALGDREILLVLNNCEQVARACAELVATLLGRCDGLRVLASSQCPLGLSIECRVMLGPLALPAHGDDAAQNLEASPAVQLLVRRAESFGSTADSHADRMAAVALARRMEGNPLGLELAAARVAALGWGPTLQTLADHFQLLSAVGHAALPRHRSLDSAIGWGCSLLSADQLSVWRALSIFRGGWTLDAARAVVADLLPDLASIAVTMAELVEHSMIERDPEAASVRFRMHEAYRCYARAMSSRGPEWQQLSRQHALHMAAWLESFEATWDTTPDSEWTARAVPDLENLEAALGWALENGEAQLAVRLVTAGFGVWRSRDLLPTVLSAIAHPVLSRRLQSEALEPLDARLQLVHAMALLGESSDAESLASAGHAARLSADIWLGEVARAQARLCLVSMYARTGQTKAQTSMLKEAADLVGSLRRGRTYGWLCIATAWERQLKGDLEAALHAVLQARVAWGAMGAWLDKGRAMIHAADLRLALGDISAAIAMGHEAVTWFEGGRQRLDQGRAMVNLGAAYAARGDYTLARDFLCNGVQALRGQDFTYWAFDHLALLAATLGEARWAARWIGYADAGYSRHRAGRRLVNEDRSRRVALELISPSLNAVELCELMGIGAVADEQEMLDSVADLNKRMPEEAN